MARRKILLIEAGLWSEWLRGHDMSRVETNWPKDARIVGCGWDENRNQIRIAAESEEWDDVPDGCFAPEFSWAATRHVTYEMALYELVRRDRETTAS